MNKRISTAIHYKLIHTRVHDITTNTTATDEQKKELINFLTTKYPDSMGYEDEMVEVIREIDRQIYVWLNTNDVGQYSEQMIMLNRVSDKLLLDKGEVLVHTIAAIPPIIVDNEAVEYVALTDTNGVLNIRFYASQYETKWVTTIGESYDRIASATVKAIFKYFYDIVHARRTQFTNIDRVEVVTKYAEIHGDP